MDIGAKVTLQVSASKTVDATLVAVIKAGVEPDAGDVMTWYGGDAVGRVFEAAPTDRLVFEMANGKFVVMHESPWLQKVVRPAANA